MKKIILAQVLTAKGKTEFSGLYDRHGNAVIVEVERDSNGVSLIIWQNEQKSSTLTVGYPKKRYSVPVPCTKTATGVRLMTTAERNRRWFHEILVFEPMKSRM